LIRSLGSGALLYPEVAGVRGSTDRLTTALIKGRILRAWGQLRAAVEALDFEAAQLAQHDVDGNLDELVKRLRARAQ